MIKLSDKGRRVLRRIYQGLGAATVSLLFQACYGTPIDNDSVTIQGKVSSKTDIPIPGIKVSVEHFSSDLTNENGNFNIYVYGQTSYELQFEDIDGPLNGSYKPLKKTINIIDADSPVNVQLDNADEE
jgi:putative lipoprotein (rSAM/lipoprotein system)